MRLAVAFLLAAVGCLWSGRRSPAEEPASIPGKGGIVPRTVLARGKWILDPEGEPLAPLDTRRQGLQTSGLTYRDGVLWAVGDQRSNFPGHLFRIDPGTCRLTRMPIPLAMPEDRTGPIADAYRIIPNPDYEAVAADRKDPKRYYGVVEMRGEWLVKIRLQDEGQGIIEAISSPRFPAAVEHYQGDSNFGLEGITTSDDGKTLYLAYERDAGAMPRIYSFSWEGPGDPGPLTEVPVPFREIKPRPQKGILNANGLEFIRWRGHAYLIILARDNERLIVHDLEGKKIHGIADMDLRDPDGEPLKWASPEGVAADPAGNRIWVVSDPDSMRGNYRRNRDDSPTGPFRDMVPLLFEFRLEEVMGG